MGASAATRWGRDSRLGWAAMWRATGDGAGGPRAYQKSEPRRNEPDDRAGAGASGVTWMDGGRERILTPRASDRPHEPRPLVSSGTAWHYAISPSTPASVSAAICGRASAPVAE